MNFERLVNQHKDAVYRQMVRMCGNHDDAEDVLAESLVKAYRALGGLQDEEAFRAWLTQIGRRTCGRLKRREALRPTTALEALAESGFEIPDHADSPEVMALEMQTKDCIMDALEEIPNLYKEIYLLRDVDQLSVEETAKKLGISVPNVKTRLHRARAMLREKIDAALCS